jgi:hypothetical protein
MHFKYDLHNLVNALLNIHMDTEFYASRSSSDSTKPAMDTSGSGGGDGGYARICSQMVSLLDYDRLISFFENL